MAIEQVPVVTTELLSDLIKIGIPSIIALAGIISSIILATKGHKKDIKIEQLRINNEEEKEKNKRKGELVQQISENLTKLHGSFISYATMLCAKSESDSLDEIFPEKSRKELSELYLNFVDELHDGVIIQAHVSLLGNGETYDDYHEYWSSLSNSSNILNPNNDNIVYKVITDRIQTISEKYRVTLDHLSKVFLFDEK